MSDRFVTILALVAIAGAVLYMLRDKIPSPDVSRDRPFFASTKQRVFPSVDGSQTFEVLSRAGAAGPHYFCAAAEYAREVLRADMSDLIVTISAEAPSDTVTTHRSVFFQVVPQDADPLPPRATVIDLGTPGQAQTIAIAMGFCRTLN